MDRSLLDEEVDEGIELELFELFEAPPPPPPAYDDLHPGPASHRHEEEDDEAAAFSDYFHAVDADDDFSCRDAPSSAKSTMCGRRPVTCALAAVAIGMMVAGVAVVVSPGRGAIEATSSAALAGDGGTAYREERPGSGFFKQSWNENGSPVWRDGSSGSKVRTRSLAPLYCTD